MPLAARGDPHSASGRLAEVRSLKNAPGGDSPVSLEGALSGRLDTGDATFADGSLFDEHKFSARQGEHIALTLESPDFDAYLILEGPRGYFTYNDDANGKNSRVEATLPEDGVYKAKVTSFGAGAKTGRYSLRIERLQGSAARITPVAIRVGEHRSGRLAAGDPVLQDGSYYDEYRLEGTSGQNLVLRLSSSDFDPLLSLYGPDGFYQSNDDADGKNSRIDVALPTTGSYTVRVNSYESGPHEGRYDLSVSRPTTMLARGAVLCCGPEARSAAAMRFWGRALTEKGQLKAAPSEPLYRVTEWWPDRSQIMVTN